ncbi:hypothetical protein D9M69_518330 [compost metagenome]
MSYQSFFLAVLSLALGGCAVYDYDNDYYGRRYYGGYDYRVHRYYDEPRTRVYYVDQRRIDHRYADQRYDDRNNQRRYHDGRKDYDKQRYDKRYRDDHRKYRNDRRYHQPRQDNFQERRFDYTPRLQNWSQNQSQPGYRQPSHRQQYRVQPGYEARPHNNPRYNNRSDWSQQNRR